MKDMTLKLPFTFGVIVFVKNESATIGKVIDQIVQRVDLRDVFVIDGHSVDETVAIVQSKGVNFLRDNGKGKGAAIRFAIKEINRDVLVFMDSDGSHQAEEIFDLLGPFALDKNTAMVVGSRFKGGSDELSNSMQEIIRRLGNYLSSFIINLRWRVQLTDTQNGFRAILKKAVLNLNITENTFAIEQELTMKLLKNGMKIVEVPSFELKRVHGKSHIDPFKMLPSYASNFIRNIFF
jgi:glycosyltransferase involved in cell wall biosynthesis